MGDLLRQYWLPVPALPRAARARLARPRRCACSARTWSRSATRAGAGRAAGRQLPPPRRLAVLRPQRGGRAALRLPRLEVRRHRRAASTCRTSRPRAPSRTRCARAPIRCRDVNGVIWAYMGPRADAAAASRLRDQHPAGRPRLPAAHDAGGVQLGAGARGRHRLRPTSTTCTPSVRPDSDRSAAPSTATSGRGSRCCRPTTAPATRPGAAADVEGLYWHRITQFILPFYTMIAASDPHIVSARAWVPLDDQYNLQFVHARRASIGR